MARVGLSVVVVVHNMEREFPRTLQTLSPEYQRRIDASDYEVVVVDNGSSTALDPALLDQFEGSLVAATIDDAPASPARAVNHGISLASGAVIGLIVDGARMASPGLLAAALTAGRLDERVVVASLGWHLGPTGHMEAQDHGYDEDVEDDLLASTGWLGDGYQLFDIATLAASSGRGWFGPLGESSGIFMPRHLWDELGGLDERFILPGGGLVNHDLYRRACLLHSSLLVVLLGEGTFHQYHGGAATSGRHTWDEMNDEYRRLRGEGYVPVAADPLLLGRVPPSALAHIEDSVALARGRILRAQRRGKSAAG